jgi:hypothetical protein
MSTTLQQLLAMTPERRTVVVAGATFHVRGMTGAERAEMIRRKHRETTGDGPPVTDADYVALTLVDENGDRAIPDGDARVLDGVNGSVLKVIAAAALDASVLSEEAQLEAAKKFGTSQS